MLKSLFKLVWLNLSVIITLEPNMTSGWAEGASLLHCSCFPAWPELPEPMAYRRPRGFILPSLTPQITVLVASFFVALGAGTNYVRWLASLLLNNWTTCSLVIFRCGYSFCFRWILADAGEFHLHVAYSPQLGARLNISYTQLNIIGLAGNGEQFFAYVRLYFDWFSRHVYFWSDLGKDGGLTRPSDPFYSQFRVPPGWIFWYQIPIWFWPTTWHKYSANSQLLHASSL